MVCQPAKKAASERATSADLIPLCDGLPRADCGIGCMGAALRDLRTLPLFRRLLGAPLVEQHGIRTECGWLSEILFAGLPRTADRLGRAKDAVLDRNRRQPWALGNDLAGVDPETLEHARHLRGVLIQH